MSAELNFDVIVVGAGAAGIAAYAALRSMTQGTLRICVVEGRDRIGRSSFDLDVISQDDIWN
jgi:cation diffusion facilitator CzcD-associated flavoprotein CzcO